MAERGNVNLPEETNPCACTKFSKLVLSSLVSVSTIFSSKLLNKISYINEHLFYIFSILSKFPSHPQTRLQVKDKSFSTKSQPIKNLHLEGNIKIVASIKHNINMKATTSRTDTHTFYTKWIKTYLKLRSGLAHLTIGLGTGGTTRNANVT